ncbi:hypothetical protein Poli38472_008208 [Pythium oligandrum]|uniref:Ubiquitin-like protease family profile domain-containing protein n=1 Tax=Pythium oligandrum TaxID=41045 RepID=A0A8K1FK25_PYTOL|nr:hypothetical protein Poli38472_008208 [Pythium oligandrum]|eukprot:TMW65566.1 hypothetical protein Poli38472_008208 [Pythium oligandrum]
MDDKGALDARRKGRDSVETIDVDRDSTATLSSDEEEEEEEEEDGAFTIKSVPLTSARVSSSASTSALARPFGNAMAVARGNLLSAAEESTRGANERVEGKRPLLVMSSNCGKKRRLVDADSDMKQASLDFFIEKTENGGNRHRANVEDEEDEDVEMEDVSETRRRNEIEIQQQLSIAPVSAMNCVSSGRTLIYGRWFGRCELRFHPLYLQISLDDTTPGQRVWRGTLRYLQLQRFSLSRNGAPYFAILEMRRGQLPPEFAEFCDSICAQMTQDQAGAPVIDVYGAIFFFDDDLELARCQSMSEISRDLGLILQVPVHSDETRQVSEITAHRNADSTGGGVLSSISGKLLHQQKKDEAERRVAERKAMLLLSYPYEDAEVPGKISIVRGDIDRLKPGEFLNDTIIDFYIRYLWRHLAKWQQKEVYFFSSHFFTQLSGGSLADKSTATEDRFRRVLRWTQKDDLFSKKFLFVPVNDSCHWSVAVICNPSSAILQKRRICRKPRKKPRSVDLVDNLDFVRDTVVIDTTEEASDSEEFEELEWSSVQRSDYPPCILFLDSLRCHQKKKICSLLRRYLEFEYKIRHPEKPSQLDLTEDSSDTTQEEVVKTFDAETFKIIEPAIPLQENSSDCGVFLLMYTAQILKRFPVGVRHEDLATNLSSSMSKGMFDHDHVRDFRDYLHQLIFTLHKLHQRGLSESHVKDEGLEDFVIDC